MRNRDKFRGGRRIYIVSPPPPPKGARKWAAQAPWSESTAPYTRTRPWASPPRYGASSLVSTEVP